MAFMCRSCQIGNSEEPSVDEGRSFQSFQQLHAWSASWGLAVLCCLCICFTSAFNCVMRTPAIPRLVVQDPDCDLPKLLGNSDTCSPVIRETAVHRPGRLCCQTPHECLPSTRATMPMNSTLDLGCHTLRSRTTNRMSSGKMRSSSLVTSLGTRAFGLPVVTFKSIRGVMPCY